MLDKIKKILIGELKDANIKTFLFFLALSGVIWVFVQFSKEYSEVLSVPIEYANYPKDKLVNTNQNKLRLRVRQSGFQLIWFKMFRPDITIDLSDLPNDDEYLKYDVYEHHKELLDKMPIDFTDAEFLDKQIEIPYSQKAVKKVLIKPKSAINYAPGYSSISPIKLTPDSVKISGPKKSLDTINYIYTQTIKDKGAKKDITSKINLKKPNSEITLFLDKVDYEVKVEKFTERQINVPITVVNVPKDTEISLYPSMVEITFNVSLKKFKQIQPLDFKVVCDYKNIGDSQEFLIPKITQKPENIENVSLFPKKIQYVLKK